MKKKVLINRIISFVVLCLLLMSIGVNVLAASNVSNVSATWYVGASGNGYVNGSDNGAYHGLDAGAVILKTSCTNVSTNKPAYVALYREKTGFDYYCGQVTISSTSTKTYTFSKNADKKSTKYYLICSGGKDLLYHTLDGKLYNK